MKFDLCLSYKQMQIIKHALQHYTERDGATEKDLESEKSLLIKVENEVNGIKERYGIR